MTITEENWSSNEFSIEEFLIFAWLNRAKAHDLDLLRPHGMAKFEYEDSLE